MSMMDPRIPVLFGHRGDALPPGTAVVIDGHDPVDGAAVVVRVAAGTAVFAGCACCGPRGRAAQALGGLFLARARGEVPFFRQVVVMAADASDVRAALAEDVLVRARYRPA